MPIRYSADVATAGATATHLAKQAGFGPITARSIGIVASEMSSNVFHHASGGGELRIWLDGACLWLETRDLGPGMLSPEQLFYGRAAREAKGLHGGRGLGEGGAAIARLMDHAQANNLACGGLHVRARIELPSTSLSRSA